MFALSVNRAFSAAHSLSIASVPEPVHRHDWRVTLVVVGDHLDSDGLLADFHALERLLDEIISPWRDSNLNDAPAFRRLPSSAENVARIIADAVAPRLPTGVRVERVAVTESPNCIAEYRPPQT